MDKTFSYNCIIIDFCRIDLYARMQDINVMRSFDDAEQ